ncbi:hypothetical protein H2509_15730 [Stappia sp. F7233]|uniref:Uncharacterized protein n=1 Tax=Stappia albiluteola TaxID=2758565 RepID=A0A839AJA1_9HYPH|nr:hypothetical protein [Stappia albiluteola]MBA5778579.1 hypothetical protein [Stappia albiluteola]
MTKRIFTIIYGYLIALITAAIILLISYYIIGIYNEGIKSLKNFSIDDLFISVLLLFSFGIIILIPFIVLIIALERASIRNVYIYVSLGACASIFLRMFDFAIYEIVFPSFIGAISGWVYWRIAGRTAGSWRAVKSLEDPCGDWH